MIIKMKLKILGIPIEIEESNFEGDIFEFLDKMTNFLMSNEELISSHKIDTSIFNSLKEKEIKNHSKEQYALLKEKLESGTFTEKILKLANDLKMDPEVVNLIFDFGAETQVPPILIPINKDVRTEQQRVGIIITLYLNSILNDNDKMTSHSLTPILLKSNIDPSASSKAFKGDSSKFVKIDGKSYRITPQGIIKAKKYIQELSKSI